MKRTASLRCPFCASDAFRQVFLYRQPPAGETRFDLGGGDYRREVLSCDGCGHFLSLHEMDTEKLYSGQYVDSTYGETGIASTFQRIVSLPEHKSDNAGRAKAVAAFAERHFGKDAAKRRKILDVGSGLCVFLHRMKQMGWDGTALDPDPRAVAHAQRTVGVAAVCGDFMKVDRLGPFDVITFNKVLEHVEDPVRMLERSRDLLHPGGFVYVELPDGETASADGPGREEFFIEHHHVFSAGSVRLLAEKAGFRVASLERLKEPSTKYTLRAFVVPGERR